MNRTRTMIIAAVLAVAALAGNGCTTPSGTGGVEVQKPRTYGQSLIYGYETHAVVNNTAATLAKNGIITKDDAVRVLGMTNIGRSGLDAAMRTGCPAMEAYLKAPKDQRGQEPACLSNLPPGAVERLQLAVGAIDQAFTFVNSFKKGQQ